jgi:hypothetical protein
MAQAMQARLDALVRQQHVPRPMLELLSLLVANAIDTDSFKQSASARIGVVEGLARQPTGEIAAARAECVSVLDSVQRNVELLERKFRGTYDAVKGEAEMRLEQISRVAQDLQVEVNTARFSMQEAAADCIDDLRREVREACELLLEGRESCEVVTRRKLDAMQVAVLEETGSTVAELASDARRAVELAGDELRAELAAKVHDAEVALNASVAAFSNRTQKALETINTLPLLETHRLCCATALLEARIDVIDAVASKSVADELRLQLDEVARRVQRCELREAQLDDKVEAWAAGGVRGEAAPTQRGALASASLSPVATPRRKGVPHFADDRQESLRVLSESVEGGSLLFTAGTPHHHRAPPLAQLRDSFDSQHAVAAASVGAAADMAPTMRHVIRLQSRLDALEASALEGTQDGARAVQLVRRLSQLIDSDVVARLEEAHAAFQALAHVLGLDAAAVVDLWHRHDAEARELEDEAAVVMVARSREQGASARKAWLNASGGDDRADESLELDRAHLSMRHRIEACRLAATMPVLAATRPLPNLGVELADGAPPLGGLAVIGLVADSPCDVAGLQPEDVILRVNKAPVSNREEFLFAVQTSRAAATFRRPPTPAAAVPRGLSPTVPSTDNVKLAVYRPSAAALLSLTLYLS